MYDKNFDFFKICDYWKDHDKIQSLLIQGEVPKIWPPTCISIPTYRRKEKLKEAIDSVIAQNGFCDVILVISDNSPERNDETELLLKQYSEYTNILYYKNTINIGMAGNWNKCFLIPQSEWVIMMHDDDLMAPNCLHKLQSCEMDSVDGVFIRLKPFIDGTSLPNIGNPNRIVLQKASLCNQYLWPELCATGNLFRRSAVLEIGGFTDKSFAPDACFTRFVYYKSVYIINQTLVYYRKGVNESTKLSAMDAMCIMSHASRNQILKKLHIPQYIIKKTSLYMDYCFEKGFQQEWNENFRYSEMPKFSPNDLFVSKMLFKPLDLLLRIKRKFQKKIYIQ